MSLTGEVAIVTGGSDGIGGATARRLAEEGAAVLIVDVDAEGAAANAEAITKAGGRASSMPGDVSKGADIKAMIDQCISTYGKLTVLVNNAYGSRPGLSLSGSAVELAEEGWDHAFDIGIKSHYLAAKHAIPHMENAGGGSIVNISSVHSLACLPGAGPYDAAKWGVVGLGKSIAVELAASGVRVNALSPGLCNTMMWQVRAAMLQSTHTHKCALHPAFRVVQTKQWRCDRDSWRPRGRRRPPRARTTVRARPGLG